MEAGDACVGGALSTFKGLRYGQKLAACALLPLLRTSAQ